MLKKLQSKKSIALLLNLVVVLAFYCYMVKKRRDVQAGALRALRAEERMCTEQILRLRELIAAEEAKARSFPEGSAARSQHSERAAYYSDSRRQLSAVVSWNSFQIRGLEMELRKPFYAW
jgi:hypothetical protein